MAKKLLHCLVAVLGSTRYLQFDIRSPHIHSDTVNSASQLYNQRPAQDQGQCTR